MTTTQNATAETCHQLSRWDLVDWVFQRVIQQKDLSVDQRGSCMYRGLKGTKCAVGHCIPDSRYSLVIEKKSLGSFNNDFQMFILYEELENALEAGRFNQFQIRALALAQKIHDSCINFEKFKEVVQLFNKMTLEEKESLLTILCLSEEMYNKFIRLLPTLKTRL